MRFQNGAGVPRPERGVLGEWIEQPRGTARRATCAQWGRGGVGYVRQVQCAACRRTPSRIAVDRATGFVPDTAIGKAIGTIVRSGTGAISIRRSDVGRGAKGASGPRTGASSTHGQTVPSQHGQVSAGVQLGSAARLVAASCAARPKGAASAKVRARRTEMTARKVMRWRKISAWIA